MRKPRFDPETTLVAYWDQRERDLVYAFPRRVDGRLLHLVFTMSLDIPGSPPHSTLLDELTARGYDLATLRFSIRRCEKPRQPHVTATEACPHGCIGACSLCTADGGTTDAES